MSFDRTEHIRSTFSDVIQEGGALKLRLLDGSSEEVVPIVPQGIAVGRFHRVRDGAILEFDASNYSRAEKIGIIQNPQIVDARGNPVHELPRVLDGYSFTFEVWSIPNGDVYRVEVWPDEASG